MEKLLDKTQTLADAEVIKRIVDGETALMEILIRRYNPVLYKIARSFGFNHQDAEDLMQETHFSGYKNLAQFGFRASYKTWISKIMMHNCIYKTKYGYKKNEQPHSDLIDEYAQPMYSAQKNGTTEQTVLKREFTKVLENTLQQIPVAYRMVFILREAEGLSVAETAELLNISPVNVKVRTNRAKAMIQKQLEQLYSSSDVYEFNLIYCDKMVKKVFDRINADKTSFTS